jgi:hypothetical protein
MLIVIFSNNLFRVRTPVLPLTHEKIDVPFKTKYVYGYKYSNFSNLLQIMFNKIIKEEHDFITKISEWTLVSIDFLQLRINKINPLVRSTYLSQ